MNDTGYGYDGARLHAPVVRLMEIAEVLRPVQDGGLLQKAGVLDVVNFLRRPDEAGMAGGVFVVVRCYDAESWTLLRRKGHLVSRDGLYATLFLPYHLLGVETATSVLSAALLGLPTGGGAPKPRVEVGIQATRPLLAGERLSMDRHHAIAETTPLFIPPAPISPDTAIPFYMAANARLTTHVEAGTILTYAMVEEAANSTLWALKREQDHRFLS
jgi:predicted homoserine dehydrogenase-like protein